MTSKLVVNTIEADTGISSVSFGSSISLSSTSKFFFGAAGIDIGADTNINRPASGVLAFNINSSEKVRIDSSGHMGLGISPSDIDSIGKALNIASSTGGAIYLQDTDDPTVKFAAISYNGTNAGLQIHAHHSSSYIDLGTNGTERLRITSDGKYYFTGTGGGSGSRGLEIDTEAVGAQDEGVILNARASGTTGRIKLQTNSVTAMTILGNGGNIGIGTDNPTYKLHVDSGDAAIGLWKSRGSAGSFIDYSLGVNGAQLGFIGSGGQILTGGADSGDFAIRSEGDLCFSSGGAAERLRIDSSGRVYIGATSGGNGDTDDLVISGSGKKGITLCSTDGSESRLTFADGLSGVSAVAGSILYTHSNDSMDFNTSTTRRLRISGSGPHLFLGGITSVNEITETSTNSGLVIGNTSMGNGGLAIINSTSGTGRIYFGDATGSDAARNRGQINYYHSTDSMEFATSRAVRLRIDSSGNITKPNNPSFRAYLTGSTQTANANADIIYQNTGGSHGSHNIGGHYNTSNGRFTAPVAGRYVFIMMHIPYGNYSNNATYISVNGVNKSAQHFSYTHGNLWSGVTNTAVLNLSAGDYVTTKFSQQTTIYGTQWGTFNGYLLS